MDLQIAAIRDGIKAGIAIALCLPFEWNQFASPAFACHYRHLIRAFMNQNSLYLLIGALVVVVIALGVYVYREESQPSGVELRIDESGVSIEEN